MNSYVGWSERQKSLRGGLGTRSNEYWTDAAGAPQAADIPGGPWRRLPTSGPALLVGVNGGVGKAVELQVHQMGQVVQRWRDRPREPGFPDLQTIQAGQVAQLRGDLTRQLVSGPLFPPASSVCPWT